MHATEAGNDTEKCLKRVSTPKQATRMTRMPQGTNTHARNSAKRDFQKAYAVVLARIVNEIAGRRGIVTSFTASRESVATDSKPPVSIRGTSERRAMLHRVRERYTTASLWCQSIVEWSKPLIGKMLMTLIFVK